MRFKKAISFLLVFTLLAGGISPVYADDVSLNDIEYEEEVSGSSAAESFLFDVSEGDISADEGEDIADPDISETVETVSDISSNDVSENDISANETDIIEVEEDLDLIVDHGESIASEFIEVPAKILADKAASAVYFSKYYNQIDPVAQKIYKAFEDKSEAFLEHHDDQDFFVQVDLVLGSTPLFSDEERTAEAVKESFMNAYAAFDYDHPEIFWFAPSNFTYAKGTNKNTGLVSYVKLKLNSKRDSLLQAPYDSDPGLVEAERSEREVFADYIISLTEKESDLNAKLGIINDELTNYSYYNRYISSGKEYIKNTDKRAYESISAMTLQSWLTSSDDNGDTAAPVCEGYSRAFKMICDRIGIDCIVVPGHTSSSGTGAHMWNFVRDPFGFWYAVDVTWDDPLRADEWKNRITPDDQIRNYFLVGGKTKRGGSTFESRHIADGPFWKDGTAFAVPPLCDVTYDENTENCVFFAAVTDDETVVINAESEQFKYTKSLAQAIEYTNGLSEANPDRKVVFQLNCDFNFAYDALKDLSKASNIYLSLNGFEVTFAQNGHWSVPALNIVDSKGEGYIINLTGDSDVSGNVLFDSANVLCNGYDLTVEPNVTIALKSLEAADFDLPEGSQLNFSKFSGKNVTLGRNSTLVAETLDCAGALTLTANSKLYASTLFAENITLAEGCVLVADNIDCKGTITVSGGSKLIIKGERSEIGAVDISAGETDPYILRGKETELTILDGVTSPDESGMLNFGILDVYDLNASDCFLLNTADLPLIDSGAVLFASLNEGSNAKLVRYISKSPNETDVVYEKGLVVAKDILAHLYALNTESGTKTHMESFHTLGEAFAHITAIANTSKGYEIILTGDTEINGSMTVPSKCDSLTIKGQKSFADATPITHTIEVSGPVSFPVDVTLENVILKADSLTAKKRLTLRSSQILLSTDLSVETLDMTDSLIDAEGTVSIKSLVLRGDSNEIYYLPDNTSYIVPDGSAVLYRDGEFSAAFADLNDALKAITKVSDVNSDYRIVLYEDAKEEGTKLSLPKAGYAHSVTITSNGEAKKVYIKNALTLGCDVKLENIALYSSSKVAVKLNKYALSLEGVSFGGDTYISTITGSSVSGASALRLSDMGTLYVGKVSKVGTLQLSDHTALYAGDDMTVGLLDMDAGSALTTMRKATVSSIARPEGTWNITLDITKNKAGEITKVETPAKINGDFDEFEEGKLTLTPLGYEARDINLVYAPKLTVGVANGGTYEELIAIGNAPTLHATKKKGYIVGTDESFNAALVYDENKAIALADVSTALSEINKLATKRDYRILLLSDAQSKITSLPKTKYASSLSFEGTGQTLESSGKLSFSNDVTFKAVSLSHTGKLTLGNVTEKENVTLSTTGALTVKNIVSEDSLVIKNTISSGKSQITVKGSVTAASPIMIHLFKDKAQTSYAKVGMTVDDVRYERLVLKATGSALASSFRLAEGNLKSGCRYYSDENFTDIFSDEAYVLSKSGSDINLVYAENVEAALVTGEVFDGNMPGKGNGRILGFYGAINEAFAEIDALGDETAIYSVVIFKSTIPADILLPSHAMKVIVSGGIKGSGTYIEDEQGHVVENDPYYMYSVNFKNNVNVHCDTVFSYVELGCKSTLAFNVKEGSLELVNMVVPKVGTSFGKATLSEATELILHTSDSENTYKFSGISGPKASLSLVPGACDVIVKGSVNVEDLNIYKGETEGGVAKIDNSVNAATVNMYEGASLNTYGTAKVSDIVFTANARARFDGTTTIGNITSTATKSAPGEVFFTRGALDKSLLSITGKMTGHIKLGMISDYQPSKYRIAYKDNYYDLKDGLKLLNFTGTYNKNDLFFSVIDVEYERKIIKDGDTEIKKWVEVIASEVSIDAFNFLCVADGRMYYLGNEGSTCADNLTVLCDGEVNKSAYSSYRGEILMNFADASKASAHIDSLKTSDRDYHIYVESTGNDRYSFNTTEKKDASTAARSLTLPSKSNYASLVLEDNSGSGQYYVATKIIGDGDVKIKNIPILRVTGKVNVKGELAIEWTSLAVFGETSTGSVRLDNECHMIFLNEAVTGDVKGTKTDSFIPKMCVLPKDGSSTKTVLKTVGTWESPVILNVLKSDDYSKKTAAEILNAVYTASSYTVSDICKDGDGRICVAKLSNMKIALSKLTGENVGYFETFDEAVSYIDSAKVTEADYILSIRTDSVEIATLPKNHRYLKITTADPYEPAWITFGDGVFKSGGKGKTVFGRVKALAYDGSIKNTSGSLGFENCDITIVGDLTLKELAVTGTSHIHVSGKTSITDISGTGRVILDKMPGKTINVSGSIAPSVKVGICPYEYTAPGEAPKILTAEEVGRILISGVTPPDENLRFVMAKNVPGDSFFICDGDDNEYTVGEKTVRAYKYGTGIFAVNKLPGVVLMGYNEAGETLYEGSFFSLNQAFSEIDTLNKKKNTYTITLAANEGEGENAELLPVSLKMPSKAALVTIKSSEDDRTRAVFTTAKTITLKCPVKFDGAMPVFVKKNGEAWESFEGKIKLSSYRLELENVTGKYSYDSTLKPGSFAAAGIIVKGGSGSSLLAKFDQGYANAYIKNIASVKNVTLSAEGASEKQKVTIASGISGVTNLNLSGNIELYTGAGAVSVKKLNAAGTDEGQAVLEAANIKVSDRTTLKNARISAGIAKVGTGKFSTKYVTICDGKSEIDAKQDKKGQSLLSIKKTVKRSAEASERDLLTLGVYYNNSANRYAQWYSGMRIATAKSVNVSMLKPKFSSEPGTGMGSEAEGYTLLKKGKYIIIGQAD